MSYYDDWVDPNGTFRHGVPLPPRRRRRRRKKKPKMEALLMSWNPPREEPQEIEVSSDIEALAKEHDLLIVERDGRIMVYKDKKGGRFRQR